MLSLFARKPADEVSLTISARTFFKVLSLILVTALTIAVVQRSTYAIVLVSIASLLALALNTPVNLVARRLPGPLRGSRSLATTLAFLLVVAVLAGFLVVVLPPLLHQTTQLIDNAPTLIHDARSQSGQINELITRYHLEGQINNLATEFANNVRQSAGSAVAAVTGFLSSVVSVIIVLVLTFMLVSEGPYWLQLARSVVPREQQHRFEHLRREMYDAVRGFVNGQVLLAVIAALLLVPALIIFSVPYPAALAAVVFICCLVPMVGNIVAAFFIVGVALFQSPLSAVAVLIYYIIYQQIENFVIQPRIQASATNLSPLIVLISLVVGFSVGGLFGGLVAIPIVACLRVWLIDYLESRGVLGVKPSAPVASAKN